MEQPELKAITTLVTPKFHRHVKDVAKRNRMAIAQLARLAVEEKTKQLEDREQERDAPAAKRKRPELRVVPLDERPTVEIPVGESFDRLAAVFNEHSDKIMEVFNQPALLAIRQQEAFAAIKRLAPLTYADDRKIVTRLEAIIAEKASQMAVPEPDPHAPMFSRAPAPTVPMMTTPEKFAALMAPFANMLQQSQPSDPLVGRPIDTSRVRSRGMIENPEEEEST